MTDPVLQTVPLGMHWPTQDPFLFCAHHNDAFPRGNADLGPVADLAGRQIGNDFAEIDGWNMYHGDIVPGFPVHPHRGFETVTYVRRGTLDHFDSLGATARFGEGDVQWITAGGGIQHSEMFPLLRQDTENPLELFQIWLNLPSRSKMVDPYFTMVWSDDLPRVRSGPAGSAVVVTVVAGELGGGSVSPPPDSWASDSEHNVGIWHCVFEPGSSWELPPAPAGVARTAYVFDGASVRVDGHEGQLEAGTGAVLSAESPVTMSSDDGAEVLILQGRPIQEPVVQHGPFVLNTREQVMQAFEDYRRTEFGGWPWERRDPVHPVAETRFARYPDGRHERPAASQTTPVDSA